MDPRDLPLGKTDVESVPICRRPRRRSLRCLDRRDCLDPLRRGERIAAQQLQLDARFEQNLARAWRGVTPGLVRPAKRSESRVHGFFAGVEIAPLGCLGEALQNVFDEVPFRRAEFTFNDDVARDGECIPQLLDCLREADDLGLEPAANLENRLALNADVSGLRDIAALVESLDEVRDDCAGRMADRRGGGVHRRGWPLVQNRGPAMTSPAPARLHPAHAFPFVALIGPHGAAAFQQRGARPVVGRPQKSLACSYGRHCYGTGLGFIQIAHGAQWAAIAFIVEPPGAGVFLGSRLSARAAKGAIARPSEGGSQSAPTGIGRPPAGVLLRRKRAAMGRGDPGDYPAAD